MFFSRKKLHTLKEEIIQEAQKQADAIVEQAQDFQRSLFKKETEIENEKRLLKTKKGEVTKKLKHVQTKEKALEKKEKALLEQLQKTASFSEKEAVEEVRKRAKKDARLLYDQTLFSEKEQFENDAKRLLITALERCSQNQTSDTHLSFLELHTKEEKALLIGKKGCVISLLEKLLGVSLFFEETSLLLHISAFHPLKREVAKKTIATLLPEKNFQRGTVLNAKEKAEIAIEKECEKRGIETVHELGLKPMHEDLYTHIGKLFFHKSLGQNLLEHSKEVAILSGILASELTLDVEKAKRMGLLHDIGKTISNIDSHALAGAAFAKGCGENSTVVNGIESHHKEKEPISFEASLIPICDRISATRKGARNSSQTKFFERINDIETHAKSLPHVKDAYSLRAGKELILLVDPDVSLHENRKKELQANLCQYIDEKKHIRGSLQITLLSDQKDFFTSKNISVSGTI